MACDRRMPLRQPRAAARRQRVGDADVTTATGGNSATPGAAASTPTSTSGDHRMCTMHWNRATVARPPLADADELAPADEHLAGRRARRSTPRRDPGRRRSSARAMHLVPLDAEPRRAPSAMCPPSQRIDAPTSPATDANRGSSAGTTTSNQHIAPGTTSTTPPPLRRLTTSSPRRVGRRSTSTTSGLLPRPEHDAPAGRVADDDTRDDARRAGRVAWNSPAGPRNVVEPDRRRTSRRRPVAAPARGSARRRPPSAWRPRRRTA